MNLQTEVIRSHELDKVTRIEVKCSLEGSITKSLRDHVLGKTFNRQLYLLGSLVIVTQTPYGFFLKTQGTLSSVSLDKLVALMQEKAQEYYYRLEFLKELGDDVKTVCRLGLGPDLGTTEIADHAERIKVLEDLAQSAAEDVEPPYLDSRFGEDLPDLHDEDDTSPYPYELDEPPPAEPDRLESPGRPLDEVAQEFIDRFMDILNRFGRYTLVATFAGLVIAAVLRAAGVF